MYISMTEVKKVAFIEKVILHCHDQSLYLVSVIIDGVERYVTDDNPKKRGELLKAFNKLELQSRFAGLEFGAMVLQHRSAYDEMIGLSEETVDNTLEVSLGGEGYAAGSPDFQKVH